MSILKNGLYVAAATATLMSGAAHAGVATGTLPVSAVILENCTVLATPMVFTPPQGGTAAVDSTSTITLACTPNADFDVALNTGVNAVSGARNMKLATGADLLPYEIYQDANHTQIWGSSAGTNTKAGTAPLGAAVYTAYGRIPANYPSVSAGAYADTVTVTVTF
jgi:spore coat protein U-like protein